MRSPASLILAGIVAIFAIRGTSEGAVYARRILVTMLLALGGILGFFAWSMASWGPGVMSGALLLGIISLVAITDIVIALIFSAKANRAESEMGAPPRPAGATDPEALRKVARLLLITAPIMWLVVALLSFGIVPVDGIIPIKF